MVQESPVSSLAFPVLVRLVITRFKLEEKKSVFNDCSSSLQSF